MWVIFIICVLFILLTINHGFSRFKPEGKLFIVVSTCKRYREKTIGPLLEMLRNGGVPDDRIVVVSGGEDSEMNNGVIVNVPYQFWELTGLIWLASQPDKGDYYFMMHDTCSVEPGFWESLNKKFETMDTECSRLVENSGGSDMNMGVYKHSYIISRKDEFDSLKNFKDDEESLKASKIFGYSIEGKFLKGFPLMYSGSDVKMSTEGEYKCVVYVPALGFKKLQQNCGRGDYSIKLDVD